MHRYNGLLRKISEEYSLRRGASENKGQWIGRLLYTAIGQMALASLFDETDEETTSINHFKNRIKGLSDSYRNMYPEAQDFLLDPEELADDIYETYLDTGWLYHERYRIVMAASSDGIAGDITLTRCHDLNMAQRISGLGTYVHGKQSDNDAATMFIQNSDGLKEIWDSIIDTDQWIEATFDGSMEYLNMSPSGFQKYWGNRSSEDGIIGLARTITGATPLFYLYKMSHRKILYHQLPSWMSDDIYLAANACLSSCDRLPESHYRYDGDIVYLSLGYLPPKDECNLWRLYSWPASRDPVKIRFNRICNGDVFEGIKSIMISKGYRFQEE